MLRNVEVHDAPATVRQHEQHEEHATRERPKSPQADLRNAALICMAGDVFIGAAQSQPGYSSLDGSSTAVRLR